MCNRLDFSSDTHLVLSSVLCRDLNVEYWGAV